MVHIYHAIWEFVLHILDRDGDIIVVLLYKIRRTLTEF